MCLPMAEGRLGKVDTKALKLAAIGSTMLDGFAPTKWTSLPPLGAGIRLLLDDEKQQLVATAQTRLDRAADTGSAAEAARIYDVMYPHADFAWTRLRALTEVEPEYFDTPGPTTITLSDPLPGAPLGDQPIADIARASSLAQALATLHSAAPEPVSEAGFPVEDPSRSQFLILERLDQAAGTGRVPSSLLQHWEEEFEKVALWHFLATPIHGSVDESSVYTDQERVLALAELGRLRVSDPAIDLAAASALIDPAALQTFYDEYRNSRPRADEHIIDRAELLAEFAVLDWLLEAVDSGDEAAIQDAADLLANFNEILFADSSQPGAHEESAPNPVSSPTPEASPNQDPPQSTTTGPNVEAALTEAEKPDSFRPQARVSRTEDGRSGRAAATVNPDEDGDDRSVDTGDDRSVETGTGRSGDPGDAAGETDADRPRAEADGADTASIDDDTVDDEDGEDTARIERP